MMRRLFSRLSTLELPFLVALLLCVLSLWGFLEIADEVVGGETFTIDRALLLAMRTPADPSDPLGPHWFEEIARDVTALGGVAVLTFLAFASGGFMWLDGKHRAAVFVVVSVLGGYFVSTVVKEVFSRPRPDLVPHGSYVMTSSFPSGHSMMSAATFLTLGALLASVQPNRRLKVYLLGLALLLSVLVGVSRVYLGVHWPSDVLGGWTLGAAWALLCWAVARWLQRRGEIETEDEHA